MEKQKAILQHKIRTIQDKIYDLVQEQKILQNEFDSLEVITATHDDELNIVIVDSDINSWSEEKRVYFELVCKLNEPERSICLKAFNEEYFKRYCTPTINIANCVYFGFRWEDITESQLINDVWIDLHNQRYQFDKI